LIKPHQEENKKMKRIVGGISIIMALVLGIVPAFTDCLSQGRTLELANGKTVPMKCHWTGIAEIGVAVPLVIVGIAQIVSKRKETINLASILGVALGTMAILFPTALIGVCANPDMLCNSAMRPTLIAGGTIAGIASLILLVTTNLVPPRMNVEPAA
jgi:hypothetical protein